MLDQYLSTSTFQWYYWHKVSDMTKMIYPLTRFIRAKSTLLALIAASMLVLAGCGATSSSDDPELNDFGIIDTNGNDSATTAEDDLQVDADINNGDFRIYWEVDTNDDYTIDVYINDDDDRFGGLKLFSDFCDPDDDCHEDQFLDCDFQNDLDLICEDYDDNEVEVDITRLSDIRDEDDLPEDLYLIIEVCDPFGFDCEDQNLRVEFDD